VQDISPLHVVQTGSGALYSGVKRSWREADNSLPTSAMVDLYIHSPMRLHGVMLNF
jgi:hypothetical protein